MSGYEKTISNINKKIEDGNAVVLSEAEFRDEISHSTHINLSDIDIVTIAFHAAISGTAAMLCVPVTGPGVFTRARKIWLNGVPGHPGPAPNERLGLVDTLIVADQKSTNGEKNYDGARLIWDIIANKEIAVECLSIEGDKYYSSFTLDRLQFARMYIYNSFLENADPACLRSNISSKFLNTVRTGSKLLINGAPGIVIGCGTRSRPERKALSMAADIFDMDPNLINEVDRKKMAGGLCNLIVLAIPILSGEVLESLIDYIKNRDFGYIRETIIAQVESAAIYLKELILDGKFLLVDSDMYLKNWCNN